MFAGGGEGRGHWPRSILCFLLKVITPCCSPAQAGVGLLCAAKMQYSGLMRLKHFYLVERKVLHLKTSWTPCRFQLNPLESRDTVEFCAIQLAMLGLLRRVSCPVPSVQCLASVKCQGCRHRAYKLQTETNKTLQYWLSTGYLPQYLLTIYCPYLPSPWTKN